MIFQNYGIRFPKTGKKSFYGENVSEQDLTVLWTYDIKGERAKMDGAVERRLNRRCSAYQYAFECAAKQGNRAAIQYFLQKLTSTERKVSLIKTAGSVAYDALNSITNYRTKFLYEYYSDILCLLLCLMDEEE